MIRPDFSEFTFGYAFTENLIKGWLPGITGLPIFPSLIEEGKATGGYDVGIPSRPVPILIQFKLPQIVTRRSRLIPNGFATPYYRMHIGYGIKSIQHQSLLRHEASGHAVFYVCPRINDVGELDRFYQNGQVPSECNYFRPSDIGDLDDQDHFVSFERNGLNAWLYSEPKLINFLKSDDFRKILAGAVENATHIRDWKQYFYDLSEEKGSNL